MKKFKTLSEIDRGRLLFQTESDGHVEELYRATTNEYVLCRGTEEIILPGRAAAIEWAVNNKQCEGNFDFFQQCAEVVRIPFGTTVPEVRPSCDNCFEEIPIDPLVRMKELIQHPAFNTCIVQHNEGEEVIRLNKKQRKEVIRYVLQMIEGNYRFGDHVRLSDEYHIFRMDSSDEQYMHRFSLFSSKGNSQALDRKKERVVTTNMETFVAFSGKNLPYDFKQRDCDELTWLKIDSRESYTAKNLKRFAVIAIAVNMFDQVDYEAIGSPAMNPLEILFDQGILPYENPEPFDY
ncbi:MAG: hypothetical protein ACSHX8_08585 [Opitutaceae bacterium]